MAQRVQVCIFRLHNRLSFFIANELAVLVLDRDRDAGRYLQRDPTMLSAMAGLRGPLGGQPKYISAVEFSYE